MSHLIWHPRTAKQGNTGVQNVPVCRKEMMSLDIAGTAVRCRTSSMGASIKPFVQHRALKRTQNESVEKKHGSGAWLDRGV